MTDSITEFALLGCILQDIVHLSVKALGDDFVYHPHVGTIHLEHPVEALLESCIVPKRQEPFRSSSI